jgi:ligand-binding sensor domain-containing protein
MQFLKKIVLLITFFFVTGFSIAQQNKNEVATDSYHAIYWDKDDGLPHNITNVMLKDARGFLWVGGTIGSGGFDYELCRFDGTVFKKYFPDPKKRGAINSAAIYSFKEDSLHNIWMGTSKGLSRYDIKADTFTNFLPLIDSAFPRNITPFTIAPFWATKDEMYCMEPSGAITAINIHTLKREKILRLSITNRPIIVWNTNKSFFDKSSKSFWLLNGSRLEQIFPDGKVQFYTWPNYEGETSNGHRRHDAEDMCYDPDRNSVWINSGEGLLEFSLKNKQFRKTEALSELTKQKSYDRGVGVDIDRQGRIWFSTLSEGIFIYDPQTEQAEPVFSDHDIQLKTGEDNLHIYCDGDGIVWTSAWFGQGIYELLHFDPPVKRYGANPSAKNTLSSGLISTIVPGPQGKLWLGTADGLNIFDPVTETFEVLREKDLPGIKGTAILPLYIDTIQQKALLNAGSQQTWRQYFDMGMYEMDIKTRKCSRIVFMDGSKRIDTFRILHGTVRRYKNGIIFCDELHGVWEVKQGSLVANLLIPLVPGGSGFGNILLLEDSYLFLDHGSTLPNFTFENKNGKWTRVPSPLDSVGWWSALYNKKDQTYWVSQKDGLVNYNKEFRVIKAYSEEDGYNGPMLNMQLDNYGNLWFANQSKQIGRLNTATGIFSTFSETDSEKRDFDWLVPLTKDLRGDLYFGIGAKWGAGHLNWGLDRVYPERFSSATSVVYFNTIFINQKTFSLNTPINEPGELSLRYDQNAISIEAGIIDYYSRKKDKIRYKLGQNGKEGDWQYPSDHNIRFESLSPGSYRLVVQSSNIYNEFNGSEKILMIKISPAFWNTWWFRTLAVATIILSVYLFYRRRIAIIRKEEGKKTAFNKQLAQIEMKALKAQMNPHFIFNCMNSINSYILENDKKKASDYLTKFSTLIRLILENSDKQKINLADELAMLETYIQLEQNRLDNKFDYHIHIDPSIKTTSFEIPSLILQPFVENAIWHGLIYKEGGIINISIKKLSNQLICIIEDNGVGRTKAELLKQQQSVKHHSMGMKVTEDRLRILNQLNLERPSVNITDLFTEINEPCGTRVEIVIPV